VEQDPHGYGGPVMTDCPTVAFVRDVLGRREPAAWPRTELAWQNVIRFTSSHLALPAFAARFCELASAADLEDCDAATRTASAFLKDILGNNRARNAAFAAETGRVAGMLSAERIPALTLKGAAFLLEDSRRPEDHASWRFMGDIDLLVPQDRLSDAASALELCGYRPAHDHYDPARDAHLPPLMHTETGTVVELHDRLFGLDALGLDVDRLWHDALPIPAMETTALRRPSRAHRLHHLIMHAQLHNRHYPVARLLLKDVIDFDALVAADDRAVLDEVFEGLDKPEHLAAARAFVAGCEAFLNRAPSLAADATTSAWAGKALANLTAPGPVWYRVVADAVRLETHRLRRERGHVRHRLHQCVDLGALRYSAASWSYKARQKYWG
jgi:hypothetical protein